jgi:peptidoglycan/xylan/chitin deacetylase (PgdA/CDA1 family)
MYLVKTPSLLKPFAKDLLWHVETTSKELYLTFDDGPTPQVTEKALELLKRYHANATFFCLGKNVEEHPSIYQRVLDDGHAVGNHSYDHPDGWKTGPFSYLRNVARARPFVDSALFRPPYGRITPAQVSALKKKFTLVIRGVSSYFTTASKPNVTCSMRSKEV